jgi:hypothetical protein
VLGGRKLSTRWDTEQKRKGTGKLINKINNRLQISLQKLKEC